MGAPQVTIETITVTRPLKVIAFTCCVITVLLMVVATSTSDWIIAEGWREGLFTQCVSPGARTPLPFGMENVAGCSKARTAHYLNGCAALVIFGLITDFFGTMLTCLGLKSTDPLKKYKYYRVAIYALIAAGVFLLLAVIIYPVQFSKDLADEPPLDGGIIDNDNDFDNDKIPDHLDDDDDNDGIKDVEDTDDDGDGIPDAEDDDDDNDGIPDDQDGNDEDFDNDGISNDVDEDDDNDGILDQFDDDDDNDGITDDKDKDDDNDGIDDDMEEDLDGDGMVDAMDGDDDGDGISDGAEDDDGDGIPNDKENDDGSDEEGDDENGDDDDDDGDDGGDDDDDDDDDDGARRVYSFGFGYGATWGSIILIFASVVLLICDRESEEIFYKERQIEEEEEEETGEA